MGRFGVHTTGSVMRGLPVLLLLGLLGSAAPAAAVAISCDGLTTLQQFIDLGADGCFDQDKLYTSFSYSNTGNLIPATGVSVDLSTVFLPGIDEHHILIQPAAGGAFTTWITGFTFGFTVSVCDAITCPGAVLPDPPALGIVSASVQGNYGSVANTASTSTTLTAGPSPLATLQGASAAPIPPVLFAPVSSITSLTTLTTPPGGFLNTWEQSFSESFPTGEIPEPASMALIGSGLVGFGLLFRRRNQVR